MKRAFIRLGRNLVALTVMGGLAYIKQDPKYLILAPVINSLAKYLREKWMIDWLPV